MLALPVEVAEEVRVVVRTERARRRLVLRQHATALDHSHGEVDRDREEDHEEQELQHPSSVEGTWSPHTLRGVKEFVVYTALRILLFLASLAVVIGVWMLLADQVPLTWAVVVAFVVSGLGSYFLLNRQRAAFARRVEERAERATAKFEEMKAREDSDDS